VKAGVAALVLLLALSPTLFLLGLSLGDPGYREVLTKERQFELLWRSVWISSLSTLLALLWGVIVARGIRALTGWGSAALETVSLLPLLLPSVVIVMGWVYFTGPNGPIAALFGEPLNVFRPFWAALVMSMCYFPCVTILLLQAYRTINPAWEAVARMHAGRWRSAWQVWRPLFAPYLATGAVLVFLLSFGDYGIPWALSVNVYPVEIFAQMTVRYDIPRAMAYCAPPIAIALLLMIARHLLFPIVTESVGYRVRTLQSTGSRGWIVGALLVIAVADVLPMVMLARTMGGTASMSDALVIAGRNALVSCVVSFHAMWMLVLGGAAIAWALRGMRPGWAAIGSMAATLPLLIPGAAVGLGLVMLYERRLIPETLFHGEGILSMGIFCRMISFPILILTAAFGAIRPRLTHAARLAGVSEVRAFWGISVPLGLPGIAAAALLSFVFAMGELATSALVNPPGIMTLPMRISSLLHIGEDRIVAALCLTLAGLILGCFFLGTLVLNRKLELNFDARRA